MTHYRLTLRLSWGTLIEGKIAVVQYNSFVWNLDLILLCKLNPGLGPNERFRIGLMSHMFD